MLVSKVVKYEFFVTATVISEGGGTALDCGLVMRSSMANASPFQNNCFASIPAKFFIGIVLTIVMPSLDSSWLHRLKASKSLWWRLRCNS